MPTLLPILTYTCFSVLLFYFVNACRFTFGKSSEDRHLRESLAFVYTVAAAYFTYRSISAIRLFAIHSVDLASYAVTPFWVQQMVGWAAACVAAAFICNFARSIYMLKSLDHAIFEPVPNWKTLSTGKKRNLEFAVRCMAAAVFLLLEAQLDGVGQAATSLDQSVAVRFSMAGQLGAALYVILILWWIVGRWIAGKKMPVPLLAFYGAGLLNATLLILNSQPSGSESAAYILFFLAVLSIIGSMYMVLLVAVEVVRGLRGLGQWWANRQPQTSP